LRPAIDALCETDLLRAEWLAVGLGAVLPVRGTVADVAVQDEQSGAAGRLLEDLQGVLDAVDVVGVADPQDVPGGTKKARRHVFRERYARVPFDSDVVVVVDPAEVIEPQVACQGGGFRRDSLHQAPVAADGVDAVIEDVEARLVEVLSKPFLGDRHAHACGDSLAQWAGGGFNARYPV